jgi:prepilin-type N-terminal cleavage/methylation domain-containing protein
VNKTHLFFCEKRKLAKGLTLVEVIVGMLISALCLSTALQAYVAAVGVGVKAQDSNVALKVIQSDLEDIRQKAQEQSDCSLQTPQPSGYAQKLMTQVQPQNPGTSIALPTTGSLPSEYQIARTMSVDNSALANTTNVLQISYDVTRSDSPVAITKLNTAVMPDAAMVCP